MLLERLSLEVSRICVDSGEDVAAVATHVFIDESAHVTATDGHCLLRVDGTPQQEPSLFMEHMEGVDTCEDMALPGDVVTDFLRAWQGEHVIVRRENGSSASMASADGETSRLFEIKQGTVAPPKFDSLLNPVPTMAVITLSVELLLKLARTLKALKVAAVTLHVQDGPDVEMKPIRLTAMKEGVERVQGALLPMRL